MNFIAIMISPTYHASSFPKRPTNSTLSLANLARQLETVNIGDETERTETKEDAVMEFCNLAFMKNSMKHKELKSPYFSDVRSPPLKNGQTVLGRSEGMTLDELAAAHIQTVEGKRPLPVNLEDREPPIDEKTPMETKTNDQFSMFSKWSELKKGKESTSSDPLHSLSLSKLESLGLPCSGNKNGLVKSGLSLDELAAAHLCNVEVTKLSTTDVPSTAFPKLVPLSASSHADEELTPVDIFYPSQIKMLSSDRSMMNRDTRVLLSQKPSPFARVLCKKFVPSRKNPSYNNIHKFRQIQNDEPPLSDTIKPFDFSIPSPDDIIRKSQKNAFLK